MELNSFQVWKIDPSVIPFTEKKMREKKIHKLSCDVTIGEGPDRFSISMENWVIPLHERFEMQWKWHGPDDRKPCYGFLF